MNLFQEPINFSFTETLWLQAPVIDFPQFKPLCETPAQLNSQNNKQKMRDDLRLLDIIRKIFLLRFLLNLNCSYPCSVQEECLQSKLNFYFLLAQVLAVSVWKPWRLQVTKCTTWKEVHQIFCQLLVLSPSTSHFISNELVYLLQILTLIKSADNRINTIWQIFAMT